MICPQCGFENIRGADECAGCQQDLTYLDEPATAAGSSVERAIMEEPVGVLEPAVPVCVRPDTPVHQVIRVMLETRTASVLVMDRADLVGIFTERDLLMDIAGRERALADAPIREWMTPSPETVEEDDTVAFAIHKMDVGGYRHLPMMHNGRPIGVLSVRDIVRFLADYLSPATA
jgi:CBS domain-containing protein